jgi:hypothetical protein
VAGRFPGLVDAFSRRESPDLNLRGQDLRFVVVEKFKEGNVSELFGVAGHD